MAIFPFSNTVAHSEDFSRRQSMFYELLSSNTKPFDFMVKIQNFHSFFIESFALSISLLSLSLVWLFAWQKNYKNFMCSCFESNILMQTKFN